MSADVHAAIRDALRADDITAADLRYSELRPPDHRRTRQVSAVAGAMAVVVVLAVALALTVGQGGGDTAAGPNDPLTGVVGYRWQVVGLTDSFGSLPVPAALHAQIGFTRDGYVLGKDSVNALQANYHVTAQGYAVRNATTTLIASTHMSPQQKRTVAAVDAMFSSTPGKPGGSRPLQKEVVVRLHRDTLTLSRAAVTLTLHRTGTQPDFFARTPSRRPTTTG